MNMQFESSKNSFRVALAPIFELLLFKKEKLDHQEWISFIAMTESSIINNPEQFLGKGLPPSSIIDQVIKEIFLEYVYEDKVEA